MLPICRAAGLGGGIGLVILPGVIALLSRRISGGVPWRRDDRMVNAIIRWEITMKEETIRIDGMSCGGCVNSVKKALEHLPLERAPDVEIGSARVEYDEAELSHDQIIAAIEDAGFDVPVK
ncbi:MAG: copZ [Chlorobi bacterium]|nr:copZ [Chlorobiota bacterium]